MSGRTAAWLSAVAATASLVGGALAVAATPTPDNVKIGKALFLRSGLFCASCHTLKAAGSRGRDGPNLDQAKPAYATIVEFVTDGRKASRRWPTGMPGYGGAHGEIPKPDVRDIAAFIFGATHR